MFSSKLIGIFGLGQTDQHSTLLPSFQPQNIFLNFKSLKKKCYICFMSFYYWVWWKQNASPCLLWPQKKLGQWKKLRFCFFFLPIYWDFQSISLRKYPHLKRTLLLVLMALMTRFEGEKKNTYNSKVSKPSLLPRFQNLNTLRHNFLLEELEE